MWVLHGIQPSLLCALLEGQWLPQLQTWDELLPGQAWELWSWHAWLLAASDGVYVTWCGADSHGRMYTARQGTSMAGRLMLSLPNEQALLAAMAAVTEMGWRISLTAPSCNRHCALHSSSGNVAAAAAAALWGTAACTGLHCHRFGNMASIIRPAYRLWSPQDARLEGGPQLLLKLLHQGRLALHSDQVVECVQAASFSTQAVCSAHLSSCSFLASVPVGFDRHQLWLDHAGQVFILIHDLKHQIDQMTIQESAWSSTALVDRLHRSCSIPESGFLKWLSWKAAAAVWM